MTSRRHARLRRDRAFPAETTLPDAGEGLVVAVAGGSLGSARIGDDGEGVAAAAALDVFSVAHVAWLSEVELAEVCKGRGVWCGTVGSLGVLRSLYVWCGWNEFWSFRKSL